MTEQQQTDAPSTPSYDIPAGQYKARGVEGSEQFGTGDKGDQVAVDLVLVDLGRTVTTILHFSDAAMPYSLDRLRLMGVPIGPDNEVTSLAGLATNEVPVIVKYDPWTNDSGETEMKMKVEIISTRFSFKTPMGDAEKRGFFARVNTFAKQRAASVGVANPKSASPGAPTAYPADWDKPKPDPNRPPLNIE